MLDINAGNSFLAPRRIVIQLLFGLAFVAALGGYVQSFVSKVFIYCGGQNGPSFWAMVAITLTSILLFLLCPHHRILSSLYKGVQAVMLALCAYEGCATSLDHPRTVVFCMAISVLPVAIVLTIKPPPSDEFDPRWPSVGQIIPLLGFSFLLAIIFLTMLVSPLLVFRGAPVSNVQLGLGLVGAILCTALGLIPLSGHMPRRGMGELLELTPPLSILALALARAKFPDQSFDSFLYKTSLPFQMAEWRTAVTAMLDHSMLATNFQELANGLIRMLASDYEPRFISTIACAIFYMIATSAFRLGTDLPGSIRLVRSLACASLLCLTEALSGQGTVYHEASIVVMLAASLAPGALWPIFLTAAVSVKMTAIFVAPLVAIYQLRCLFAWRRKPIALLLMSMAVGLALIGTQVGRNLAEGGRILGFLDVLSNVTDPPSPNSVLTGANIPLSPEMDYHDSINPRDHHTARGGVLHNAALAVCNIVALDLVCKTEYDGLQNFGFHVFPASRALVLSILLAAGLLISAGGRRFEWARLAACLLLFGIIATFSQITEGRHLAATSTGFAVLLLATSDTLAGAIDRSSNAIHFGIAVFGAFLVGSDCLPGLMTNVGWDCRHDLWATADKAQAMPSEASFRFAQELASKYKQHCHPPGLPPSIVGENAMLIGPYLGVHRIASIISDDLNARFLDVAPARRDQLSRSVLAFAYKSPRFFHYMAGAQADRFETCFQDKTMTIACSKDLPPLGHQCARQIKENR